MMRDEVGTMRATYYAIKNRKLLLYVRDRVRYNKQTNKQFCLDFRMPTCQKYIYKKVFDFYRMCTSRNYDINHNRC